MVEREKDQYAIDIVSAMAERTIKKLWVVVILLIVLFVGSNAAWIWYESQFIDEEWTIDAYTDGDGTAVANGNGEVFYYGGESKSDAQKTNP